MKALYSTFAKVTRKLDGKGRLNLPGDFREAAGFAPDEPVEITLASIRDAPGQEKTVFIITRKEDAYGRGHEADRNL